MSDVIKTAGSTVGSNGALANMYATNPSLITPDQNALIYGRTHITISA